MKSYHVKKSHLRGRCLIPPSKSQSIRSILFASLADGTSTIDNILLSPDIFAMIKACQKLGAVIDQQDNRLSISGVNGKPKTPDDVIDAGNSGQVLRFIACIAGLQSNYIVLTGDHSIRHNRPVKPLIEALPKLGMVCESLRGDDFAPLIVKGPFQRHETRLEGHDSQPVSGLLMALAFYEGVHTLSVDSPGETPWIELTLSWLDRFDIDYQHKDFSHYQITGKKSIAGFDYAVPGDLSSLAYPLVAALITDSEITIANVDLSEPQGDKRIVDILKQMGANITVDSDNKTMTVAKGSNLKGIEVDINDCIDCITIMAVVGCFAGSPTTITGAGIARMKESDRISAIATELTKMGAKIDTKSDGMVVYPAKLHGAELLSYHDHRIALSLAVAAMAIDGETVIHDVDCVNKSFPNFASVMQGLGGKVVAKES